jgi:hypothetical protein
MSYKIIKLLFFFLVIGVIPVVGIFSNVVNAQDSKDTIINNKKNINVSSSGANQFLYSIAKQAEKMANALANRNSSQIEQQKIKLREIMVQQTRKTNLKQQTASKYTYKQPNRVKKSNIVHYVSSIQSTPKNQSKSSLTQIAIQAKRTADALANKNTLAIKRHKKKLMNMMAWRAQKNRSKSRRTNIVKTYRVKHPLVRRKSSQPSLNAIATIAENLADAYADGNKNIIAKRRKNLIETMQQRAKY